MRNEKESNPRNSHTTHAKHHNGGRSNAQRADLERGQRGRADEGVDSISPDSSTGSWLDTDPANMCRRSRYIIRGRCDSNPELGSKPSKRH